MASEVAYRRLSHVTCGGSDVWRPFAPLINRFRSSFTRQTKISTATSHVNTLVTKLQYASHLYSSNHFEITLFTRRYHGGCRKIVSSLSRSQSFRYRKRAHLCKLSKYAFPVKCLSLQGLQKQKLRFQYRSRVVRIETEYMSTSTSLTVSLNILSSVYLFIH